MMITINKMAEIIDEQELEIDQLKQENDQLKQEAQEVSKLIDKMSKKVTELHEIARQTYKNSLSEYGQLKQENEQLKQEIQVLTDNNLSLAREWMRLQEDKGKLLKWLEWATHQLKGYVLAYYGDDEEAYDRCCNEKDSINYIFELIQRMKGEKE